MAELKLRILIVDDASLVRLYYRQTLEAGSYVVEAHLAIREGICSSSLSADNARQSATLHRWQRSCAPAASSLIISATAAERRPGAAVSMPLAWDELRNGLGPSYFNVQNAPTRLANVSGDPWADFRRAAVYLPPHGFRRHSAA